MLKWSKLDYFGYGEWDVVKERLRDEKKLGFNICPERGKLFKALRVCPYGEVKVCIIGQDPYPTCKYATGIAFSIPEEEEEFPASLRNIYAELVDDLNVVPPATGNLLPWCDQGVLLWNAYPSCREGIPASHHWPEWALLTQEIVEKLDDKGHVVFCLLGNTARGFNRYIRNSRVIETSHPSPLGAKHGFLGSRIFSRINQCLDTPIDWSI